MVPKMFDGLPPVTRPRILEVGKAGSFKKLAMLLVGHAEFAEAMKQIGAVSRPPSHP